MVNWLVKSSEKLWYAPWHQREIREPKLSNTFLIDSWAKHWILGIIFATDALHDVAPYRRLEIDIRKFQRIIYIQISLSFHETKKKKISKVSQRAKCMNNVRHLQQPHLRQSESISIWT